MVPPPPMEYMYLEILRKIPEPTCEWVQVGKKNVYNFRMPHVED